MTKAQPKKAPPSRGSKPASQDDGKHAGAGAQKLNGTALAVLVDLGRTRFTELEAKGLFARDESGLYDVADNVRRYVRWLREQASGRGGSAGEQLSINRAQLAKEQSDKAAMDNAVRRGELLETDRVIEEYLSDLGELRAGLYTIPSKVGQECETMTPAEISAFVAQQIDDVLISMRPAEGVVAKVKADQMGEAEGRA